MLAVKIMKVNKVRDRFVEICSYSASILTDSHALPDAGS